MITLDEINATGLPLEDHGAIAAALSQGRTKLQKTAFGTGTILAAFKGTGGQFLDAIEAAGATNRDLHWLMQGTILRGVLDVGNPDTRAGMEQLALAMPQFADGIAALLAMGVTDDVVTAQEVAITIERG